MLVLGLTGSIGMGKSTTARMFRDEGVPVHDADAEVHSLYRGAAVRPVGAMFPEVVRDGVIDRTLLRARVLDDGPAFRQLESIVHPLVRAARESFLTEVGARGSALALLDIPLLFETGADRDVDRVIVVSAPESVQKARVMARPGMTAHRYSVMLSKQIPDAEKRRRADWVVETGDGLDAARAQVRALVAEAKVLAT